jgi:hypothetical protein
VSEARRRGGGLLQGPERSTPVGPRSDNRRFRTCNRDGVPPFVARHSIKSSLSDRLGTGRGVTSGTSDLLFWRRLLSKPERSGASHTWGDNRRRGRSNGDGISTLVSWDVSKSFRQGVFAKRATWTGGFLLHGHTSAEGSSLGGTRNDIRFDVCGRERPGFERRSGSFGSANGGRVCSG